MRGTLLNPFEGISRLTFGGSDIVMTGQEFAFWMWRVQAIRVQISMSATADPDTGEDIPPLAFDQVFFCPENPDGGPAKTEREQAIFRKAYSSVPQGLIWPITVTGTGFTVGIGWARAAEKFANLPDNEGWVIPLEFEISIGSPNGISGARVTSAPPGIGSSFQAAIIGQDLLLGTTYVHSNEESPIPVYASGNFQSVSGILLITAVKFYEWKDRNGVPTYDRDTGANIYPG